MVLTTFIIIRLHHKLKSRRSQCLCNRLDYIIPPDSRDNPDVGRQLMMTTQLVLPVSSQVCLGKVYSTEGEKTDSKDIFRTLKDLLSWEYVEWWQSREKRTEGLELFVVCLRFIGNRLEEDTFLKCQPAHLLNKSLVQTLSSWLALCLVILWCARGKKYSRPVNTVLWHHLKHDY